MLLAILLVLWGHVVLLTIVWRGLTHGFQESLGLLMESTTDHAAAVLNISLALVALLVWLLAGLGFVQRRRRQSNDLEA